MVIEFTYCSVSEECKSASQTIISHILKQMKIYTRSYS